MSAVGLALVSALLFGAMTVALRLALRRSPHAELGALATVLTAFVVALLFTPLSATGSLRDLALYALAGALAPGLSQLFFTLGVRDAGASRASVVVGTAPLFAVAIAVVALSEPLRLPLAVGALLIVVGGIALIGERIRPEDFKRAGVLFALTCTMLFAVRDNFVRWFSDETQTGSIAAAAATLFGGLVVGVGYVLASRARRRTSLSSLLPFVPVGLLFGVSYVCLFAAYYRGRVTVVSPLVATESLWGVLFSVLLLARSELVGRHLLAGALLVVAGGALIGASR